MYREEESPGSIRTEDSFNIPSVAVIGKSSKSFFYVFDLTISFETREEASTTTSSRIQSCVHLRAAQLFLINNLL